MSQSNVFFGIELKSQMLTNKSHISLCQECRKEMTSKYCPDCGSKIKTRTAFDEVRNQLLNRIIVPPEGIDIMSIGYYLNTFIFIKNSCISTELARPLPTMAQPIQIQWRMALNRFAAAIRFSTSHNNGPKWYLVNGGAE